MNDGFMGFKALGWGAVALLGLVAVMPSNSISQWNAMRVRSETTLRSEMQRPSLLKRKSTTTTTTTGGTTSTSTGTTTTTTSTTAASYPELSTIPSNFDINSELIDAPIPGLEPDPVGAFRFICNAGQILADDPIVYPGQPGKSHLHQFYGNTGANAYSTYESLRTTGQSTCMSPLNRSGYWMPAMLDGQGNVVRPDYVAIYYKRRPASDPKCNPNSGDPQFEGVCIPLPNGLRFIFGFNMLNPADTPTGQAYYNCDGPTGTQGHYPDIPTAMQHCPAGNRLGAIVAAPDCWDGKNLDSADHRSHVAYSQYGSWGYLKCPADHPYLIPTFTLQAWYSILPGDNTSKWSLSSDAMFPGHPAGYTLHADWFGAWDDTILAMWTDNCINKNLSCSGGNLGNGKMMKMFSGFSWTANPRLVPIPQ
jgi:hypothetical protein